MFTSYPVVFCRGSYYNNLIWINRFAVYLRARGPQPLKNGGSPPLGGGSGMITEHGMLKRRVPHANMRMRSRRVEVWKN